jgi:hypothetical protein
MTLTAYLLVESGLRRSGVMPLLLLYAYMPRTGSDLPLHVYCNMTKEDSVPDEENVRRRPSKYTINPKFLPY